MTKRLIPILFAVFSVLAEAQGSSTLRPDPPMKCSSCDEWNVPQPPFKVYGNTYFVGVAGLSAVLIVGEGTSILLDGGLPQSAPVIDSNIRALQFRTEDIEVIGNSHAHYDHAAGIAALQRLSGATVVASARGAEALRLGHPTPDDPQYGSGMKLRFPRVANVTVVQDGEVVRAGSLAVTAHHTPGHTPGATSWTWRSCEGSRCLNMVYADSLSSVADDGFRFTATKPSIVDTFRQSIAKVEKLPCDILLAPHPSSFGMAEKLAKWKSAPEVNPFIDAPSCRNYAAAARKRLDARIVEELKGGLR